MHRIIPCSTPAIHIQLPMTRSVWAASFVFVVALLLSQLAAANSDLPHFEESPCPFLVFAPEIEGETIICGWVTVPENRAGGEGTVDLPVAIIKGRGPSDAEPLVYLEGGPGGSALVAVMEQWTTSALRDRGDIIVFDQRGTGYSFPSLDCSEIADEDSDSFMSDCREALVAQGIDLTAYNSRENAADVADLLTALEINEASLYGISYGTRLALTVIRDHPERIRAVILDGVYPPHVQGLEEQANFGNRAFEVLFDDCAASPECDENYPQLRETFYDMVTYLNDEPMPDDEFDIYGDDVLNEVFQLLYDTAAIPYLPMLIYAAYDGDVDAYHEILDEIYYFAPASEEIDVESLEYEEAVDDRLMTLLEFDDIDELYDYLDELDDDEYFYWLDLAEGIVDDDSEGMFASVECQEEVAFNVLDEALSKARSLPAPVSLGLLSDVEQQFLDCEIWGVGRASEIENMPVESSIPTLLLSGNYDPITPPEWGEEAARYLSSSYHFVFPNMGHGTIDAHACPSSIALAFLDDPQVAPEATCVALMGPPEFALP